MTLSGVALRGFEFDGEQWIGIQEGLLTLSGVALPNLSRHERGKPANTGDQEA